MNANPYPGPRPFAFEDAEWFCGREATVQSLSELVQTYPVTLLYGRSGTGKTSLIQAGLRPELKNAGVVGLYVRVPPESSDRCGTLIRAIRDAAGVELDVADGQWTADLGDGAAASGSHGVTVIIDQAEELFSSDGSIHSDCKRAVQQLAERCTRIDDGPRLTAMFAFREEALAAFDELAAILPHGTGIRQRLAPISLEEGVEVVATPAMRVEDGPRWSDDAARVVCKSAARPDGSLNTLVLQCICRRVWNACAQEVERGERPRRIALSDVATHGQVGDALAAFVREASEGVASASQRSVREVLRFLETNFILDGARQPLLWPLTDSMDADWRVLRALSERRVLIDHPVGGTVWFELAHEGLVGAVIAEAEAHDPDASRLRALEAQARRWKAGGHAKRDLLPFRQTSDARRLIRASSVTDDVRLYVDRSAERRSRLAWLAAAGSVALSLAVIVLTLAWSVSQENNALRQVDDAILVLQSPEHYSGAQRAAIAEAALKTLEPLRQSGAMSRAKAAIRWSILQAFPDNESVGDVSDRIVVRQEQRLREALAASVSWPSGVSRWRAPDDVSVIGLDTETREVLVGTTEGELYVFGDSSGVPLLAIGEPMLAALTTAAQFVALGPSGRLYVAPRAGSHDGLASPLDVGGLPPEAEVTHAMASPGGAVIWATLNDNSLCAIDAQIASRWHCVQPENESHQPAIMAVSDDRVIRYAAGGTAVSLWRYVGDGVARLSSLSATPGSGIQSAAVVDVDSERGLGATVPVLMVGTSRHALEIGEGDGRNGSRHDSTGTPTVITAIGGESVAVGTFVGSIALFERRGGTSWERRCAQSAIRVSGSSVRAVSWIQTTATAGLFVTLSGNGMLALVDAQSCSTLWQEELGLLRIASVERVDQRRFAVVAPGGEVAVINTGLLAGGVQRVVESTDGVYAAGEAGSAWPLVVGKDSNRLWVQLPSGRPVSLDAALFRNATLQDAAVVDVGTERFVAATTRRGVTLVNLSDLDTHLEDVEARNRRVDEGHRRGRSQSFQRSLPLKADRPLNAASVRRGILLAVAENGRAYSVELSRLIERASPNLTPLAETRMTGEDKDGSLDELVKAAGGRIWDSGVDGEVIGVGEDVGPDGRGLALLVRAEVEPGDAGRYELVLEDGGRWQVLGLPYAIAERGIVAVENGFVVIDVEGHVRVIRWSADGDGGLGRPQSAKPRSSSALTASEIGAVAGRGCAIATTADRRFVLAGGSGGVLVASVDGEVSEWIPSGSPAAVCALAPSRAGSVTAVQWVTQEGLRFAAPCKECAAGRSIDDSIAALKYGATAEASVWP